MPLEALRRSLPWFVPVVIWMVVARTGGVAERPAWLLAGALGLLPLAGFLLNLSTLLFAATSERGATRRRLHSLARWAVLAAIAAAALGLVVRGVPVLPSVADLVDRAGFGGLLLTALATWLLREDLLASVRGRIAASQAGRVLTTATHVVPGLLVAAAVAGLAGWTNLGWAIARGVAAFLAAAGLALLLCGVLRDFATVLKRRYGGAAETGAPGATEMIEAGLSAGGGRGRRRRGLAARQLLPPGRHGDARLLDRRRGRCAAVRLAAHPDLGGIVSAHRPRNGGRTGRSALRRSASIAASVPC